MAETEAGGQELALVEPVTIKATNPKKIVSGPYHLRITVWAVFPMR